MLKVLNDRGVVGVVAGVGVLKCLGIVVMAVVLGESPLVLVAKAKVKLTMILLKNFLGWFVKFWVMLATVAVETAVAAVAVA
jgi:hypothetical protein